MKKLILINLMFVNIQGAHHDPKAEAIARQRIAALAQPEIKSQYGTVIDKAIGECLPLELQNIICDYLEVYEVSSILDEKEKGKHIISLVQLKDGRLISCLNDGTIRIWQEEGLDVWASETLGKHEGISSVVQLEESLVSISDYRDSIKTFRGIVFGDIKKQDFFNKILWREEKGKWQAHPLCDAEGLLTKLEDGRLISYNHEIKIYEQGKWQDVFSSTANDLFTSIIQLKDGRLAACMSNGTIYIIKEAKGKWLPCDVIFDAHRGFIRSIIQLKDGRLASCGDDRTIRIWKEEQNKWRQTDILNGHEGTIKSIIQLNDEKIASCSFDKTIRIWQEEGNIWRQIDILNLVDIPNLNMYRFFKTTMQQLKDGRLVYCVQPTMIQLEDGKMAYKCDGITKIWEKQKGKWHQLDTFNGSLISLNDGRLATYEGGTIIIWYCKLRPFQVDPSQIEKEINRDKELRTLLEEYEEYEKKSPCNIS